MMVQIGDSRYCMPLRSGYDPLWVEDETRTIHCQEYRDRQLSMFEPDIVISKEEWDHMMDLVKEDPDDDSI